VFWHIKEAIEAYFARRPFQLTVRAGCVIGRKRAGADTITATDTATFEAPDPITE
jgi:hypothetical protein